MLRLLKKLQKYNKIPIHIGRKSIQAIIADTWVKRMLGLMYFENLPINTCMLFIFGNESLHEIWMHGMLFSIDVLWIDSNMKIIDIQENLPPCKGINCKIYKPCKPSKYIIELEAGYIKKNKIKKGLPIHFE
ncbi:MAG: DUF192 domain-containing protein [Candidatus Micrarchaeaceae archaeon]